MIRLLLLLLYLLPLVAALTESVVVFVALVLFLVLGLALVSWSCGIGLLGWAFAVVYTSVGAIAVLLACLISLPERSGASRILGWISLPLLLCLLISSGSSATGSVLGSFLDPAGMNSTVNALCWWVFGDGLGLVVLAILLILVVLWWALDIFSVRVTKRYRR